MVTDCKNCPLRRNDMFPSLASDDVTFMRRFKAGELKVDAGTPLLMEGSNSPQLFTTLSGMGLRYKMLPDGQRQVVNFVLPGDFIGLQAGVMGEMKHSVEATTGMVLCVFDRSELWNLYKNRPDLGFDLTWAAAIEEHFLGEALTAIGQMSAIERLAWGLARFYYRCEQLGLSSGQTCPFPFKQQDLADVTGLSLVHTNKTLKKLRTRQMLSVQDGVLNIMDVDALADIAPLEMRPESKRPLI